MEFVQFHPTGMVWPPGVRGLLVTEAVRGEGGILRNKDGERFMWNYLPEDRRAEYAATDEEAARWVTALSEGKETDARRPPELSTRDNVARAIYTEVREGRGSPARRRLPRHQLPAARDRPAQAARRCTSSSRSWPTSTSRRARWRSARPPTTSWAASGSMPRPARRPSPACTRRARWPAGCTARTGSAATRCRTCWCSGHGRGRRGGPRGGDRRGALRRPGHGPGRDVRARRAARADRGEDPYAIQRDLQEMMQRLVGIFRVEADLDEALVELTEPAPRWRTFARRAAGPTTRAGTSSSSWTTC